MSVKLLFFSLSIISNMCFSCSKEPSHRDSSFEYPQHMFWLRNKESNFQLHSYLVTFQDNLMPPVLEVWGHIVLGLHVCATNFLTLTDFIYSWFIMLNNHILFNPFMPNETTHSYRLDQSIFV